MLRKWGSRPGRAAVLEQQLKSRKNNTSRTQRLFIRQSSRSNYCGVYSTGMLLSLLGIPTDRSRSLNLFSLKRSNPQYAGSTPFDIGKVVAKEAHIEEWWWKCYKHFSFTSVSRSLRAHFRMTAHPTLLSFGAIHKNGEWKCTHIVVVISVSGNAIELLDPLGEHPQVSATSNVNFRRIEGSSDTCVSGNTYTIDPKGAVAILRWCNR